MPEYVKEIKSVFTYLLLIYELYEYLISLNYKNIKRDNSRIRIIKQNYMKYIKFIFLFESKLIN